MENIKMYKRKTKDQFFIVHRYGFNGKTEIMEWAFESEKDCDNKLKELWNKVEKSQNNPLLDPFSQFNYWWKRVKRVPITNIEASTDGEHSEVSQKIS